MAKSRRTFKQIQLEYCFDRLSAKKVTLAYELLVPDKTWVTGVSKAEPQRTEKDVIHDDGRSLSASLV